MYKVKSFHDIALKFSFSEIRMPGMGTAIGFHPIKNMVFNYMNIINHNMYVVNGP